MVLLAALLYGFAFNITAPLQRRYGALPVIWRAQLVAVALVLPAAIAGVPSSQLELQSLLAVAALGALGTGLAFYWFASLIGSVGAPRGSITIYFVPVVAIALGYPLVRRLGDQRCRALEVLLDLAVPRLELDGRNANGSG